MKVYKVTLLIVDHDEVGEDCIRTALENASYPNDCIGPSVMGVESADIGEWSDDHPLNKFATQEAEFKRLFRDKDAEIARLQARIAELEREPDNHFAPGHDPAAFE